MSDLAYTQDEIVHRYLHHETFPDAQWDLFGAFRSSLLDGLDFEHARPFLKDGIEANDWKSDGSRSHVIQCAREYIPFACDKAENHRGLSASRSLDHFRAWFWLLGIDERIDWGDYTNYGAPVLKQVSEHLEMGWPYDDLSTLGRMSQGLPCTPHCMEGCDR